MVKRGTVAKRTVKQREDRERQGFGQSCHPQDGKRVTKTHLGMRLNP